MYWLSFARIAIVCVFSGIALIRTDGFYLRGIQGSLDSFSHVSVDSSLLIAMQQPFTYFGKGRQSFVFESEDKKIVLKFFNQNYFHLPWYASLPFPKAWQKKEREKRDLRKNFYLHSYRIANEKLKKETGILYTHLDLSATQLPCIRAMDKASTLHFLDLNQLPFILQKKGTPFYPALDKCYAEEGVSGLNRAIDLWIEVISMRIDQKIADADHDVEHNWAMLEGTPFHLDPGRLYLDETLHERPRLKKEWWVATHNFRKWLVNRYPEAVDLLDKKIEMKIEALSSQ